MTTITEIHSAECIAANENDENECIGVRCIRMIDGRAYLIISHKR